MAEVRKDLTGLAVVGLFFAYLMSFASSFLAKTLADVILDAVVLAYAAGFLDTSSTGPQRVRCAVGVLLIFLVTLGAYFAYDGTSFLAAVWLFARVWVLFSFGAALEYMEGN